MHQTTSQPPNRERERERQTDRQRETERDRDRETLHVNNIKHYSHCSNITL